MAELVDALDSGSSGQYACGGSSPPFRTFGVGSLVLGLILGLFTACTLDGQDELDRVLTHVSAITDILEQHSSEPRVALEKVEAYEEGHRVELAQLDERVRELRHKLSSSAKRQLLARWSAEVKGLKERLERLPMPSKR